MNNTANKPRLPSAMLEPLRNEETIISWISELTGDSHDVVLCRLRQEYENPGSNEKLAFSETGLQRYVWSSGLEEFYARTDAFLYELAIWNCNRLKLRMRKWLVKYLDGNTQGSLRVLSIGDGLGFDSAYLAKIGHDITYFEVPGYTEAFARKLFSACDVDVTVLTDANEIGSGQFDVVICLDVLEHVPNPSELVGTMTGYLRTGGKLIVHAPFFMIYPSNPTHLKSNRRFSGNLSLYKKHSLKLIASEPNWNPLVFEKVANSSKSHDLGILKLFSIKLAGYYLAMGRFTILPFIWVNSYRRRHQNWFGGKKAKF